MPFLSESVDAIITSPPFLGSTDFLRQNRLRNWLVGWSYERQQQEKADFLDHDTRVAERYQPIAIEWHRVARPGAALVMHLGVVRGQNMVAALEEVFRVNGWCRVGVAWEDVGHLETQGRTDRGGTNTHAFLVLRRI
jgi:hypothetical protein